MKKAIAIDIGGTTTTFGVVDENALIIAKETISTRNHPSFEAYIEALHEGIRRLVTATGSAGEVVGIGIGAPCANPTTGEIEAATDLPWPSPIPLTKIFRNEFGLPVWIGNDAKAATIGEMIFGTARGLQNFIMLTLGTGVGGGVVVDGHLLGGSRGFATELGHITVSDAKRRSCGCGRHDCLQNYASAGGVVETAKQLLEAVDTPSRLRDVPADEISAKMIYDCAEAGDKLAVKVFEETGKVLGKACANYAAFTDPEAVIFFGGVAGAFKFMEPAIREALEENVLFLYKNRIKLLKSELNEADAALLGASALVFKNLTENEE